MIHLFDLDEQFLQLFCDDLDVCAQYGLHCVPLVEDIPIVLLTVASWLRGEE